MREHRVTLPELVLVAGTRVVLGPGLGLLLANRNTLPRRGESIARDPYPTQAEAIKKVGEAYNRVRLTPTVKWLFRKWLAWSR